MKIKYDQFEKAVQFFGLIGLETKKELKEKYLLLSKKYHPDTQNGNNEKFQQLNEYYKILVYYIDNFKFRFSQEEFAQQYPFSMKKDGQWSLW